MTRPVLAGLVAAASRLRLRDEAVPFALLALVIGLGSLVRLSSVLLAGDFPVNDGGMFLVMVNETALDSPPPLFTTYNGGQIPFAYPPLAFYAAAALTQATGLSTIDILTYLPLAFSILTIPAFYLLANSFLSSQRLALAATLVFATIPSGFSWLIAGGGLTRAPGLVFAILAIWQGYELAQKGARRQVFATALLGAITLLTHLEMGWFAAFSIGLVFLFGRRSGADWRNAAAVCGLVLLLTAPWWLTLTLRHGLEPLLAAASSGDHTLLLQLQLLKLDFTEDAFFPLAIGLGLLGIAACMRDRRYLLPAWLVLIFLLDPRKAATASTIPLAMLAAYGLFHVLLPAFSFTNDAGETRLGAAGRALTAGLLLIYAPLAAFGSALGENSPLHSLSASEQRAMTWARDNTAEEARFVVLPASKSWAIDATSEWFPALAERISLGTVQGYEWLPDFDTRVEAYANLGSCGSETASCIEDWAGESSFSHVYISKGRPPLANLDDLGQKVDCCAALRAALAASPAYRTVFENDGAVIFERLR